MSFDLEQFENLDEVEKSLEINDLIDEFLFAKNALIEDFAYEVNEVIKNGQFKKLSNYNIATLTAKIKKNNKAKKISLIGGENLTLKSVNIDISNIDKKFDNFKSENFLNQNFLLTIDEIDDIIQENLKFSIELDCSSKDELVLSASAEFIANCVELDDYDMEFNNTLNTLLKEHKTYKIKADLIDDSKIKLTIKKAPNKKFINLIQSLTQELSKDIFESQKELINKVNQINNISYDDSWS